MTSRAHHQFIVAVFLLCVAVANAWHSFCTRGECPQGVQTMACNFHGCYVAVPNSDSYSLKYSTDFSTWRFGKNVHALSLNSIATMSLGDVFTAGRALSGSSSAFASNHEGQVFEGLINDLPEVYGAAEHSTTRGTSFFIGLFADPIEGAGVVTVNNARTVKQIRFPVHFDEKHGMANAIAAVSEKVWYMIATKMDFSLAAARATQRGCLMQPGMLCRLNHGLDTPTLRHRNARTAGRLAASLGSSGGAKEESYLLVSTSAGQTWAEAHFFDAGMTPTALHCRKGHCYVGVTDSKTSVMIYHFVGNGDAAQMHLAFSAGYDRGYITSISTADNHREATAVYAAVARLSYESPSMGAVISYSPMSRKWGMQPSRDAIGFYSASAVDLAGNETAYFAGVTDNDDTVIVSVEENEDLSVPRDPVKAWKPYF